MRKIIFIQHEPLTLNIKKRFCIQNLIDSGFDIKYWDISQLLYSGLICADELCPDYCERILSYKELECKCKTIIRGDIIIPELFFTAQNKYLWKIICSTNALLVKFERYGNTYFTESESLIEKIFRHFNYKSIVNYFNNKLFQVYARRNNIRQYDKLLTSQNVKCDLRVNHPDYDDYLLNKEAPPILSYRYICFIDTGFGLHPDEKYYASQVNDFNLWQKKMTIFFDYLENRFNIPIVIAVHPKIKYQSSAYGGRKKIKYQTLNLVLHSEFVIQDTSISVAFPIVTNKMISLIVTDELLKARIGILKMISRAIKKTPFNIDVDDWDTFHPSCIDENLRQNYIHKYLCYDESLGKTTAQIVVDYFRSFDNQ